MMAGMGGHLYILKYVRAQGCPWDEGCMDFAAEGGHMEVLRWGRANGAPWGEETCKMAVYGGNLWVLMRERNCQWDKAACEETARLRKHDEILNWINEQT
jgi:hypothetical protein